MHGGEAVWFLVQGYGLTAFLVAHLTQPVHSHEDHYGAELHVIRAQGYRNKLCMCSFCIWLHFLFQVSPQSHLPFIPPPRVGHEQPSCHKRRVHCHKWSTESSDGKGGSEEGKPNPSETDSKAKLFPNTRQCFLTFLKKTSRAF